MRLLKREKSGLFRSGYDFSLTSFHQREIPAYAILSHRWGPSEVTLDDLQNGTALAKSKAGYKKLEFCAEQAERDGLVYFWVDTCCTIQTQPLRQCLTKTAECAPKMMGVVTRLSLSKTYPYILTQLFLIQESKLLRGTSVHCKKRIRKRSTPVFHIA